LFCKVQQGSEQLAAFLLRLLHAVEFRRLLARELRQPSFFGGDLSPELGELAEALADASDVAGAMLVQVSVIGHHPAERGRIALVE
jgi:hypothetical protein